MSVGKTKYRTGPKRVVTQEWRDRVVARLKELEKSNKWLEARLGASNGAVRSLLTIQQTSGLVDDVCAILKIDAPVAVGDAIFDEIARMYQGANQDVRERMLRVVQALVQK